MERRRDEWDDVGPIVAAAAAGDAAAVEQIYRRYRPYLAVLVGPSIPQHLRQRFDTDDVLQSAFLEVFRALRGYAYVDEPSFRGWLRSITVHKLQDRIKRDFARRRSAYSELKDVDFEKHPDGGSDSETPSVIISKAERHAELLAAIQRLPPEQRQALVMRSFEHRTFAEIGAELGLSEDAARRRYLEALESLVRDVQ